MTIPMLSTLVDTSSFSLTFASSVGTAVTSDLIEALQDFWTDIQTSGDALGNLLGHVVDRSTGGTIEIYDITTHLDGSPHGSPIAMGTFTIPAPIGTAAPLPEGCAAVCSFRADYGTDVEFGTGTRPRARDRNRFYFGPLDPATCLTLAGDFSTRLSTTLQDTLLQAIVGLDTIISGADSWALQVWSRKNAAVKEPVLAWTDDRPDYQRRRTDPSSVRRTLAFP